MENRRRFLTVLGAAALGGAGACSDDTGAPEASGPVAAGPVSDYPLGSLRALADHPLAVGRDAGGLYALSTICTHQQCDMRKEGSVNEKGLSCNCHASDFDRNGAVLGGPASRPLRHYRVQVEAGSVTVFAGLDVPPAERTPVLTPPGPLAQALNTKLFNPATTTPMMLSPAMMPDDTGTTKRSACFGLSFS